MELVKELNDIIANAKEADIYLNSGSTKESSGWMWWKYKNILHSLYREMFSHSPLF